MNGYALRSWRMYPRTGDPYENTHGLLNTVVRAPALKPQPGGLKKISLVWL